jgi:hypothetical protein
MVCIAELNNPDLQQNPVSRRDFVVSGVRIIMNLTANLPSLGDSKITRLGHYVRNERQPSDLVELT